MVAYFDLRGDLGKVMGAHALQVTSRARPSKGEPPNGKAHMPNGVVMPKGWDKWR